MLGITKTVRTLGLFIVLCGFFSHPVQAMVVAPSAQDLDLAPGQQQILRIGVGNDRTESISYSFDFQSLAFGETYDALSFTELSPEVASWMALSPAELTLLPNESAELSLTISVPAEVSPAAYPFAVLVTEQPTGDGGVSLAASVASLVFLSVNQSELAQHILINDLFVDEKVARADIANDGRGILQPTVGLTIKNALGHTVERRDMNPELSRIPVGTNRVFSTDVMSTPSFLAELWREIADLRIGVFTAELSVATADGSQTVTATDTFMVLPWRSMLVIVIGVMLVLATKVIRSRTP